MSFQIYTEKLSLKLINQMQKENKFFEYIGDAESGIEDLHRRGNLRNRYVNLAIVNDSLAGYVIYTEFSNLKANRYIEGEGDDTTLPKRYRKVLFIDMMDVAKPLQHKGLGTQLLNSISHFHLPIMLQCTEDSEGFWYDKGFSCIDQSSWLIRNL